MLLRALLATRAGVWACNTTSDHSPAWPVPDL